MLLDSLPCTSDVERSKRTSVKQRISIYQKFSCVCTNVVSYLFRGHAMSFYSIENWFLKLHKKYLNIVSVAYPKAVKLLCSCNSYDNNHECLEYDHSPISKHFLAKKFICFAQRLFTSNSPCLLIHRHNMRYNCLFRNSL